MAAIDQLPSGKWRVRWRRPDGKRGHKLFARKTDARDFGKRIDADILRGNFIDPRSGEILFGKYAWEVMEGRLNIRPATRMRDESHLRKHIEPAFGHRPIGSIRKPEIKAWVRMLSEQKGLAPRTVRECYRILGSILREAVDDRLIADSPCQRVPLPRIENKEKRFLTAQEVDRLAVAFDPRYRAIVYVGAYLGLRLGEIAGLKREHLKLHVVGRPAQIAVVGSLERIGNGWRYIEETKTVNSRRTLTVPVFLAQMLQEYLQQAPDSEFLFAAPEGGFLHYHNFVKRFWKPAVDTAGLAPLTIHELRHTCAALLIKQGAGVLTIQKRLGHKDVRTTLGTYGHLFPEQDDVVLTALDLEFRQARSA
jgi:integrase